MNRFVASLVLPAFLLACGGGSNPFEGEATTPPPDGGGQGVTPPEEPGIPEVLSNNVTRLSFDPAAQTLTVEGVGLDEVPFTATYRRRAGLDRNGYQAFTAQDDRLDRHSSAFGKQSGNGADVRAGVVLSGGPRNRFFGGGYYERDGEYTPPDVTPDSGLVSYSGSYVGLVNIGFREGTRDPVTGTWEDGANIGDLQPVPDGTPLELVPDQAGIIDGKILINADFADATVEGNIYDRELINPATGQRVFELPSVVLIDAPIDDDGNFTGTVEYEQRDPSITTNVIGNRIGDYGGTFGGENASGVAGIVKLDEFDGPNDPLGLENEEEYGVFVLDQCGQPVQDPVGCAGTNP